MKAKRVWRVVITLLVVALLLVNAVLVAGLLQVRRELTVALTAADDALLRLNGEPIAFNVAVDQAIPIRTTVPIEDEFTVPLDFEYALDTVIDTYVEIPILGRQDIAVPVETVLPISTTLTIPVAMTVPISVTYNLEAEIPVEVALPSELLTTFEELLEGIRGILAFPLR